MTVADFHVLADTFGDVAVVCPACGHSAYAPLEDNVTIGLLVHLAEDHAAIHQPVSVGRHTAPIPVSDPTGTVNA